MGFDGINLASSETTFQVANDCILVIFGACGDLTNRLLFPTVCHLGADGFLHKNFRILGVANRDYSDEEFSKILQNGLKEHTNAEETKEFSKKISSKIYFQKGLFEDPSLYDNLDKKINKIMREGGSQNIIFYLATPPQCFYGIIKGLHKKGFFAQNEKTFRRVVIEKPFGHDLSSAIKLNDDILELIDETQVYRIDHYLGKETVQNLLAFRFSNGIFEPIWHRDHIDHVQITVAESSGIGSRGSFYDEAGVLRDMVPNHVFQLLSLIAMEPPIFLTSDAVRDEKAKLLKSIKCFTPKSVVENTVRGQYGEGVVNGKAVKPYHQEDKVKKTSLTPTFMAMKLEIDNWRWAQVPFYIRTGKRLQERVTQIVIEFKKAPLMMFRDIQQGTVISNQMVLHIQPQEGVSLRFGVKVPGPKMKIRNVNMKFDYKDYFGKKAGTGYETLLYDCMMGDSTLFQRADMVNFGWSVVQPILESWQKHAPVDFPNYQAGSQGPEEAKNLIEKDGRFWKEIS